MISHTEENYLKAIFKIFERDRKSVSTNAISKEMKTSAASVTDMLNRLSKKKLINYEKWKGVTLTTKGNQLSVNLIRKHRLWEVFLVDKLNFTWDNVHDIAEQLEHIKSTKLVERLDQFLGHPKFDPHGDPIPDAEGNFASRNQILLANLATNESGIVVGVNEHSSPFLQYLDQLQLNLGSKIEVLEKFVYDESIKVRLNDNQEQTLTKKVCQNLFVTKN